jgi:probable F420-dependent oxidoreductase
VAVSLGYGLITAQVPPGSARSPADEYADTLALARLAEDAGFGSLWASEHHGVADGYLPSVTVLLAAIASVTRRARLGMGVALAPLQDPLRFAEDCAVLDQLSAGRLIVGLGLGWREEEFRAFGIPVGDRVTRMRELVEVCRLAWAGERFTFAGRHRRFDQVAVTPRPTHAVPILLGGTVEASVARAGRHGDGFLSSQWAATPEAFLRRVEVFDRGVRESGRDPASMLLVVFLNVFVTADGRLPDEVARAIWYQVGAYAAWRVPTDIPGRPFVLAPFDAAAVPGWVIAGTPDAVAERLARWAAALAARRAVVSVRLHYPGMPLRLAADALELFVSRVVPRLGIAPTALPDD